MEDSLVLSQRKTGPPTPGGLMSVSDSPLKASPGKSVSFKMNNSSNGSPSPSTRSRPVPGDMGSAGRMRSVPGDMVKSDRGLPNIRQPPNPGGIDVISSPSPGGRPKRAPSPGNFSVAPPDLAVSSQSGSDDLSPNKATTSSTSSTTATKPQQRFVFTKSATGVVPPTDLSVSSSVQNNQSQKVMKSLETNENTRNQNLVESPRKQKEFKPISSKKTGSVGHAFLQKMNWSDSDESDEDDLEVYSQSKLSEHSIKDKVESGQTGETTNTVSVTSKVGDTKEIEKSRGIEVAPKMVESNELMTNIKKRNDAKSFNKFNKSISKSSENSDIESNKLQNVKDAQETVSEKIKKSEKEAVIVKDATTAQNLPNTDTAKTSKDDPKVLDNAKLVKKGNSAQPSSSSSNLNSSSTFKSSKMAFLSKAKSITKTKEKITVDSSLHADKDTTTKVSSTSKKTISKELTPQKLDITKKIQDDSSLMKPKLQSSFSSDNISIGSSNSRSIRSRREQIDRVKKLMVRGRSPSPALNKVTLDNQSNCKDSSLSQSGKKNPYAVDKNAIVKSSFNIQKINEASHNKKNFSTRRSSLASTSSDEITSLKHLEPQPTAILTHSNSDRLNILREKASKLRAHHQDGSKDGNFSESSKRSDDVRSFENQFQNAQQNEDIHQEGQNYQKEINIDYMRQYSVSSHPQGTERVYSGAYSGLLPWSTTPLIFRIYEPTLPNSLVRNTELPSNGMSQSVMLDMKEADSLQDDAEVISRNVVSVEDNVDVFSPKTEIASYVSLAKETLVKSMSVESDDDSKYNSTSKKAHEEIHASTEMVDTVTTAENQNMDVAEWWDQSYAHSQDEEVNQDVMEALSNSMNKSLDNLDGADKYTDERHKMDGEESDDDVFDGLDSYPSPVKKSSQIDIEESNQQIEDLDIIGRDPNYVPAIKPKEKASKNPFKPVHSNDLIGNTKAREIVKSRKDKVFDDRSSSSRSSLSDSNDSAILGPMRLSKKERRKWEDWDKRDNFSVESRSVCSSDHTNDSRNELFERRSRAHENLLLHAYTALSIPPRSVPIEKEMITTKISNGMDSRQMLEKFCTQIKISPLEVFKLNRENKWQTRFLTTSKEGSWLKNGNGIKQEDAPFCPSGILWAKKLNKNHEYSISTIDNQGKGGGIFAQLARFSIRNEILQQYPLTRKQSAKFRECVIVCLYFDGEQDFSVTFACSKSSAEVITTGCSAIIDILRPGPNNLPLQQAVSNQTHYKDSNQKVFAKPGHTSTNIIKAPTIKVTTKKAHRTAVTAKNLSNQGAPHLWEA